jgi:hypothetical protein
MYYALILITGMMPELIGTYPSLDLCNREAVVLNGVCIEVGLLQEFNK